MAFAVTQSSTPLAFDALGAVKTTHYAPGALPVYTQGRIYLLNGCVQLELCAFEREPAAESRIAFAFGGARAGFLLARLGPKGGATLELCPPGAPPVLWQAAQNPIQNGVAGQAPIAGQDEQGWFWGARLAIDAAPQKLAEFLPDENTLFRGALYKYVEGEGVQGASFAPKSWQAPLEYDAFPAFEAVSY